MRIWKQNTLQKAVSVLLCLVMVLGMLPVPAFAEETGCTVADCTGSYVEGVCNACGSSETPAVPEEKQVCSHSGGTATCKNLAVCEKCGTAYGERVAHSFDADGKCSCGAECEHAYADGKCIVCSKAEPCTHEGGIATCTEQAICTKCDTAYGERTAHSYGTDGLCTCGTECEHNYAEGKCTACGMAEPAPVDTDVEAVKVLIEALPTVEEFTVMPQEEQTVIHDGAYLAAGNAYNALSEEQKAAVDATRLMALAAWFAGPSNVAPADEPATSGVTGACTWTLDNGVLTISGNGAMADYADTGDGKAPWYNSRSSITTLVINSGVTTIGANAFLDLSGITSAVIPATVTSIYTQAFCNCSSLTSVTYNGLSNPAAAGSTWIFFGCSNLALSGRYENGRQLYNIFVPADYQGAEFCGQPIPAENIGFSHNITTNITGAGSVSVMVDGTAGTVAKKDQIIAIACAEGQTPYAVHVEAVNGESVTVTKQENGTFTFSMPDSDVTVTAVVLSENDEALWGSDADALTNSGTLLDAGNAAKSGSVAYIKLLRDVASGNDFHLKPTGELTFDLNGKNIDIHGAIWVDTGTVKLINANRVTSDLMRPLVVCSGAAATVSDGTWTGTHYAAYNQGSLTVTNATMLSSGQSFDAHIYSKNNLTIGTGVTFQGASAKGNIQYADGTVAINHVSETLTTIHPTAAATVGTDIILPSGYVIYDTSKDSPITALEANKSYYIGKPDPQVKYGDNMETAMEGSWNDAINSEAPYILLLKDIELKDGNPMTIGSGKTVTLDLNGHNLIQCQSGVPVIHVNGGTFTLTGSGNVTHNYSETNRYGQGVKIDGGSMTMNGGTITGNTAENGGGVFIEGGSFIMNGGVISSNQTENGSIGGGGVCIYNGSMTMNGGSITENSSNSSGGGVCVYTDGTMTISNGSITRNNCNGDGGGIYAIGTLNLSGGSILSNTSNGYGGGIAVKGVCNLSGSPVVTDNEKGTARNNLYVANGYPLKIVDRLELSDEPQIYLTPYTFPFTNGWGTVMTNGDTVEEPDWYFKHDNSANDIYLNANNEATVGSNLTSRTLTISGANPIYYGSPTVLTATASAGGGTVRWKITYGEDFAEINPSTGVVTPLRAGGTIQVQATISADGQYKSVSGYEYFNVKGKLLTAESFVLGTSSADYDGSEKSANVTGVTGLGITSEDFTVTYYDTDGNVVTPKDTGPYTVKVKLTETGKTKFSISGDELEVGTFTISLAVPTVELNIDDQSYTGGPISVTSLKINGVDYSGNDVHYSYTGISNGQQVSGNGLPTNVGEYTVTAVISPSGNYSEGADSSAVTVTKADNDWRVAPNASYNWVYGSSFEPTATAKFGTVVVEYRSAADENAAYTATVPTYAGSYQVRFLVEGTDNYTGLSEVKTLTIEKADIDPEVNITGWTYGSYSAEENAPTVSGNSGDGAVTYWYKAKDADDSTYSENIPSAAGDYTVKAVIAETANYKGGTAVKDFSIGKAGITPTVSISGWTYGDKANEPAVSGNTGNGSVTYQYKAKDADDSTYSTTVPSAAGMYTVKATIAVTANYNGGTATVDFSIDKADISPTVDITGWKYGATANTPSVSGNSGNGAVTYEYRLQNADDSTYSAQVPLAVGDYTVKATIAETDNYNSGTAVANFSISKADITPTVSITGWAYGDTANDPSVAGNIGNGSVTYRYKAKDAGDNTYTEEVPTDAGDYTVKASIAETEYYAAGTATADFTIARRLVIVTGITAKDKTYDGTTNAELDYTQIVFNGKLDRDTMNVAAVGTFADENVGTNKTVSITNLVLGGASADNYVLAVTGQQTTGTAAITPREITVEITSNGGTYGGTIIAAAAEVKNAVSGEDPAVTLTYTGNAYNSQATPNNAGKYTVTATISDTNYTLTGSTTAEFVVAKATVKVPAIASKVYNGAVQKADVTATDKYSVAENNGGTEIGEYDVVLKLTYPDNYKWEDSEEVTKTLTFEIMLRILQDADVTLTADLTYNAKAQEPSVTVKDGESVLAKDTHYTVTYEKVGPNDSGVSMIDKPVDAGDYNAVITGIGSCDGTVKKSFQIKPRTTITVVSETLATETYTGEEIKPEITVKGVDNQDLVKDTDYTIAYENNIDAGTGMVIITGIGNYAGAREELTFTIEAKALIDANVSIEETVLAYKAGQTTVPEITVKDGDKTLVEGTDYVVGYLDKDGNKVEQPSAIGTYTVQIIGITDLNGDGSGNYAGSVSYIFVITDDVTDPTIEGVTNGKTYYTTQKAIAKDTNLVSVTKNGTEISPVVPAGTEVTLQGNTTATCTVTAVDIAKYEVSVTISMKPISTLDDPIETLTVDNVKLSDKDTIQAVLDKVNPIRKDECANATQAETDALDAIIKKCNDLLKIIADAEDAISKIQALPNPAETAPDNETAVKAYDEAKKAYDALSEHGRELVGTEAKSKLDTMQKALTAYDIIHQSSKSYVKGSGKPLTFTANGHFGKFTGIEIDGKSVDASYYDAESGSTIITLKTSYMESLSAGKHTIKVNYTDGSTDGEDTFRISLNNGNPFTGDDTHMMLFGGMAMTSLLCMAMLIVFFPRKKGKYEQ